MLLEAVRTAEEEQKATVFGYWVNDPERYGVAEFDKEGNVLSIEEKPAQPNPIMQWWGCIFIPIRWWMWRSISSRRHAENWRLQR